MKVEENGKLSVRQSIKLMDESLSINDKVKGDQIISNNSKVSLKENSEKKDKSKEPSSQLS